MKSIRTPTGVKLLWQPRYKKEGKVVQTIDANGDVESEAVPGRVVYGESYRSAGEILFNKELIEFCGIEVFPQFTVALLKHSANLLAGGYGEKPEDIVDGFNRLDFLIVDAEYVFINPGMKPFVGMAKIHAKVEEEEKEDKTSDKILIVDIQVNDDHFRQPIKDNAEIVAFMCSTIPVV